VLGPVAAFVYRQRRARAQVGAHEERVEDAGRRAGVGEPLVAARRHPREGEGGAAEDMRQARGLGDVGRGIAADPAGSRR
jgi:hypothetical protein